MFKNREVAGFLLANKLQRFKSKDTVVLGIPRGGVVVAKSVANILKAPLDIVIVRKIGAPGQSELAIGAVGPGGAVVKDWKLIKNLSVTKEFINSAVKKEKRVIKERLKKYRNGLTINIKGKKIILIDDGIATGATIEAAIKYLKSKNPKKIILATPVGPSESIEKFRRKVDELIALETPRVFHAVGEFYENFPQVTDEEVVQLLTK